MQDITTKSTTSSGKEPTLRDLYDRMGPRNGIAGRVVTKLAAEGISCIVPESRGSGIV